MPPGEAPLQHIPFTAEDHKNLKQMALFARIAGVGTVAAVAVRGMAEFAASLRTHGGSNVFGNGLTFAIALILALTLWQCAKSIDQMLDTDGADQEHLVKALRSLRTYFIVKGVVYIVAISLVCCCGVLMVAFGAALFALIAGTAS